QGVADRPVKEGEEPAADRVDAGVLERGDAPALVGPLERERLDRVPGPRRLRLAPLDRAADRVHDGDVRPEHLHLVDAAGQAGALHPLVEQLLVEGLDRRPALEAAPVEGDQLAVLREGRGEAGAAPLVPSGDELVVQGTAGGLVVDGHDEPPLSSCARRRTTFAHPNATVTYRHGQYGTGARPSANAPTVGVCRASATAGAPPPPSAPPRTAATGWCATPTGSCSGPSTWRRRRRSCSAGSARSRWRPTATTGSTTGAAPAARRRRP